MCVIIAKAKGVKMPAISTLKLAYNANPHGIGFVSSNGIYWRGMDFNEFLNQIKNVTRQDSVIIHFRLATHGSRKASNCHPFKYGDLYFAHNGVLPVRTENDMTDSETVFRKYLVPAYEDGGINGHAFKQAVLENIHTSKFAFMKDGEIQLWGKFYNEKGVYYSNFNFRSYYSYPSRV